MGQTLRDEVTGRLILPQIIEVATGNVDGGFVHYLFDNPDDNTDSATIPKVTYARQHVFQVVGPDGRTIEYPLIFGAGICGDPDMMAEESVASTRSWLAHFGQAVAGQVVESISVRVNAPAPVGRTMTVAGQSINLDTGSGGSFTEDDLAISGKNGDALWGGKGDLAFAADAPTTERIISFSDLLTGSSFQFTSADGDTDVARGRWTGERAKNNGWYFGQIRSN